MQRFFYTKSSIIFYEFWSLMHQFFKEKSLHDMHFFLYDNNNTSFEFTPTYINRNQIKWQVYKIPARFIILSKIILRRDKPIFSFTSKCSIGAQQMKYDFWEVSLLSKCCISGLSLQVEGLFNIHNNLCLGNIIW